MMNNVICFCFPPSVFWIYKAICLLYSGFAFVVVDCVLCVSVYVLAFHLSSSVFSISNNSHLPEVVPIDTLTTWYQQPRGYWVFNTNRFCGRRETLFKDVVRGIE